MDLTSFGNNSTFTNKGGLRLLMNEKNIKPYQPPFPEVYLFKAEGGKPNPVPSKVMGNGPVKRIPKVK